ncbi:MAG: MFS transporter [Thermoflavifilum sp.]|nr:MFS transporter [Thermoflavifilum sp.]
MNDHQPRGWILAGLMLTMSLAAMDTTIVSTAIPQIVADLSGFAHLSWVFSIYLLSQTITIPIYGKFADMIGRKPVLLVGIGMFLIGSAASGMAWNMNALIVFRGLQGLGAGSIMATVNTLAADLYAIQERARIQGWLSSVWGIAAIAGPAIGGAMVQWVSWRWIFFLNLPTGLLATIVLIIFLHEHSPAHRHQIDFLGAILIFLSASLLILSLLEGGQSWPWLSLPGLGLPLLGILLIFLVYKIEQSAAEPIIPLWIWKNRIMVGANLSMIIMGAVMMGPSMYLPVLVQVALGGSAMLAGFVLASSSIGWPIASAYSGRLYLHIGFRNTALLGAILITLSAGAFLLFPFPMPSWLLFVDQIILGAGFGLLSTPLLVGVQSMVNYPQRGVVTGNNIFSRYLGQTLGAALMGGLFNFTLNHQLQQAPGKWNRFLSASINELIQHSLQNKLLPSVQHYLGQSIHQANLTTYAAIALGGLLMIIILLRTPAHFPIIHEEDQPVSNVQINHDNILG